MRPLPRNKFAVHGEVIKTNRKLASAHPRSPNSAEA
jgi:hypothetical protein